MPVKLHVRLAAAVMCVVALALLAATFPAAAQAMSIDGRTINAIVPPGFCLLTDAPGDRPLRDGLVGAYEKTKIRPVVVFVECQGLERVRSGDKEALPSFGHVAYWSRDGKVMHAERTRKEFVADLQKEPADQRRAVAAETTNWLGLTNAENINSQKILGLIDVDRSGSYSVGVIQVKRASGKPRRLLQVVAVTVIMELPVQLTVTQEADGAGTLPTLLTAQKRNLAALIKAN